VSARRGFTLLEVLVALAIVAMGMAAVIGAVNSSANTVTYLREKTFATWVALNQIATVRLSVQQPATGTTSGDVDFAGRKWHWHQEVNGTQIPGMARIDVSVRPADDKSDTLDSDTGNWYATLSGIWGDAVGSPRGDLDWGAQTLMPQGPQAAGSGSSNGMTPGGFAPQPGSGLQPAQPQPAPPPPVQPVTQ
jgi:general secretion pathway protein I